MRKMTLLLPFLCCGLGAAADGELRFSVNDAGAPDGKAPLVNPWRVVALDPRYGGQWVVAGDLDRDGSPEIVAARNVNVGDVHYTSAVSVHSLDGQTLWRWGDPEVGRRTWHHDVACQIHDWHNSGQPNVIVCDEGAVVELNGRTGEEERRIPIAKEATDCLVFCDLSGTGQPTDFLVKDRYDQVWAYSREGEELWTVRHPGGHRTAHQPVPMDIDGDGRDEVLAGYALLNADGSVRWTVAPARIDLGRGHMDCARVLERGARPEDWRIAMTFCGANAIAVIDGTGKVLWEVTGRHFESVNVGRLVPDIPGPQLIVDIDHQPEGQSPIWALDQSGNQIGELVTAYSRHHKLLDWTGDGIDEMVVARSRGIYDGQGKKLAELGVPDTVAKAAGTAEISVFTGDMDGDAVPDILLVFPTHAVVYRNESGTEPVGGAPLGTGMNVTLY
jgi:outer membrane protein assembly factor BamB